MLSAQRHQDNENKKAGWTQHEHVPTTLYRGECGRGARTAQLIIPPCKNNHQPQSKRDKLCGPRNLAKKRQPHLMV